MKRKIIMIITSMIGLFILVFLLSCIPKTIDITYPAVLYNQDDPIVFKNISIILKGKLYKPLLFDSKYRGTCIIEGYDFTKDYQLIDIIFQRNIGNGLGVLSYTSVLPEGVPEINMIGTIYVSGNINTICIFGVAPSDVAITGLAERIIISAPAQTLEEAVHIRDQYRYRDIQ